MSGLVTGRLVVGMVTACTITGLFDALAGFHRAHPGVAVTLVEDNSAALLGRVRAGTADLALVGLAGSLPEDLETLPIVSEGLAAAVPPGHPLLAGRSEVPLPELAGYQLISLPQGTGIRAALDQACAAQGVRLAVTLEASAPAAVADLAARGLGVAVLSQTMATAQAGRLRSLPVAGIGPDAHLALAWRSAPGPALREFVGHCRTAFTRELAGSGSPGSPGG